MWKKYTHGTIKYDCQENERDIFIEEYLGEKRVLELSSVENLLNKYSEESEELKKQIKKNYTLQERISKLRNELEVSRSRESNDEAIKRVCEIFQNRMDFINGEPIMHSVAEHFERVKEELEKEGLWRI